MKSFNVEERKQVGAARYQDGRYGRKPIRDQAHNPFRLGDWVRMKIHSSQVLKGQSPFAGPYRIQVLGRLTFRLSDMNVWKNCRRLSRYHPSVEWQEFEEGQFKDRGQPMEPTNPEWKNHEDRPDHAKDSLRRDSAKKASQKRNL